MLDRLLDVVLIVLGIGSGLATSATPPVRFLTLGRFTREAQRRNVALGCLAQHLHQHLRCRPGAWHADAVDH